jgi:hypothetical protein
VSKWLAIQDGALASLSHHRMSGRGVQRKKDGTVFPSCREHLRAGVFWNRERTSRRLRMPFR